MKPHRLVLLALLGICLAAPTMSSPAFTGLSYIPTADVKPKGEVFFAPFSTYAQPGKKSNIFLQSQLGINQYLGAGVDYSYTNSRALFNAKLRCPLYPGAIATGIWNVDPDFNNKYYFVYSTDYGQLGAYRVHAGVLDPDTTPTYFVGLDTAISKVPIIGEYFFYLEFLRGQTDLLGVGGSFEVVPNVWFTLSGFYNPGDKPLYYINLGSFIRVF